MTLCNLQLPVTYLEQGEACYTDEPSLVMTSLRSSIAIMLFNKRLHFSGICHVRPAVCKNSEYCPGHCDEALTHMDCATKQMLEIFEFLGIGREEISVKVFGGADAAACSDVDIFRTILLNEGLHIADHNWGVTTMRKILFLAHTGEVFTERTRGDDLF